MKSSVEAKHGKREPLVKPKLYPYLILILAALAAGCVDQEQQTPQITCFQGKAGDVVDGGGEILTAGDTFRLHCTAFPGVFEPPEISSEIPDVVTYKTTTGDTELNFKGDTAVDIRVKAKACSASGCLTTEEKLRIRRDATPPKIKLMKTWAADGSLNWLFQITDDSQVVEVLANRNCQGMAEQLMLTGLGPITKIIDNIAFNKSGTLVSPDSSRDYNVVQRPRYGPELKYSLCLRAVDQLGNQTQEKFNTASGYDPLRVTINKTQFDKKTGTIMVSGSIEDNGSIELTAISFKGKQPVWPFKNWPNRNLKCETNSLPEERKINFTAICQSTAKKGKGPARLTIFAYDVNGYPVSKSFEVEMPKTSAGDDILNLAIRTGLLAASSLVVQTSRNGFKAFGGLRSVSAFQKTESLIDRNIGLFFDNLFHLLKQRSALTGLNRLIFQSRYDRLLKQYLQSLETIEKTLDSLLSFSNLTIDLKKLKQALGHDRQLIWLSEHFESYFNDLDLTKTSGNTCDCLRQIREKLEGSRVIKECGRLNFISTQAEIIEVKNDQSYAKLVISYLCRAGFYTEAEKISQRLQKKPLISGANEQFSTEINRLIVNYARLLIRDNQKATNILNRGTLHLPRTLLDIVQKLIAVRKFINNLTNPNMAILQTVCPQEIQAVKDMYNQLISASSPADPRVLIQQMSTMIGELQSILKIQPNTSLVKTYLQKKEFLRAYLLLKQTTWQLKNISKPIKQFSSEIQSLTKDLIDGLKPTVSRFCQPAEIDILAIQLIQALENKRINYSSELKLLCQAAQIIAADPALAQRIFATINLNGSADFYLSTLKLLAAIEKTISNDQKALFRFISKNPDLYFLLSLFKEKFPEFAEKYMNQYAVGFVIE